MKEKITWRVKDGPVHSIPDGAVVIFRIPGFEVLMWLDSEGLHHYVMNRGRIKKVKKSGKSKKL